MNKKILLVFLAAIIPALVGITIWSGLSKGPVMKRNDNNDTINNINTGHPLLKDVLELEKLQSNSSVKAEERLAELSLRRDAVGYYANIYLAERYSAHGKDPVPFYRKALELYDTKDVRIRLADSLAKQGNTMEAANIYGSALPDKEALYSLLRLNLDPEAIAQIMLEAKQWQSAAEFLKTEVEKQMDLNRKNILLKFYGKTLTEQGKYGEAIKAFEEAQTSTPDDNVSWWYARSLEGTGQIKKAKEIYKSLGENGAYRLGLLLEKEGNMKDAAAFYTMSSEPDSLWKGARIFDELGDYNKALENYMKLVAIQGTYQDDAAYRAYVLIDKGKVKGVEKDKELITVLSKYPVWMYRLGKEHVMDSLPEITYSKPEFLNRVEVYKNSGRSTMAQVEQFIGEKNADFQAKLSLGDWYQEQGDYYQAVLWGIRALKEQPCRRAYELAYPKLFTQEVQKASEEFNVDPFLIWAIMREESYFNKDAVSRVGALGLMQLMPSTAKDIASRLKVKFNEEELLSPETNIRFGTFYINSMLKMFSGDVDKALASYNGGAGNVKRWSQSKLGSTREGFPTAVAFLETREYITKVSNSYYIYKWLYGER